MMKNAHALKHPLVTDDYLLDDVPTHLQASQDLCINQLQQARSNLPDSMTDDRAAD